MDIQAPFLEESISSSCVQCFSTFLDMAKRTLSQEARTSVTEKISRLLEGKECVVFAYIFGSFISGDSFQDIDVGVFVQPDSTASPLRLELELEREIEDLLHISTDARVINTAPLSFVFNILKDGKLIMDRNSSLRSDFEGLIFKKYFDFKHLRDEYLREIVNAPM